ncbi:MAG: DNA (cytosine-5-)-methyltransferase [Kiritimatiellae bacterium]|nr:DNA (cytosine-5-)-methyltransferase [Kiritimatiellia bacterium]
MIFDIPQDALSSYSFLSLFSGAGGLDIGFEKAGFVHAESSDILPYAVNTMKRNRPEWSVRNCDVREYSPGMRGEIDVLLAGFPCQGFSLGGNREEDDKRNMLYREVVRIAKEVLPRVVVMENVLNLRTMCHPVTRKPFAEQIVDEMSDIGYTTKYEFFRVSKFGAPQTRRRFIFVAYKGDSLHHFRFPSPEKETTIRDFLFDLGQGGGCGLPNHDPTWGFDSFVHTENGGSFSEGTVAVPVRLSRTASEGNPVRSFDQPFPAVDTATVWGWAKGHVKATRIQKDRADKDAMFVRNPDSTARLWRISADHLRAFTVREYARLQTFPDDWVFYGDNKRELQLQVGNAVPVVFAKKIARQVRTALEIADGKRKREWQSGEQMTFFDL